MRVNTIRPFNRYNIFFRPTLTTLWHVPLSLKLRRLPALLKLLNHKILLFMGFRNRLRLGGLDRERSLILNSFAFDHGVDEIRG